MDADVRRHDLEQARDDVDLDVELAQRTDEVDQLLLRLVQERDHDTLDGVRPDELGKLRRRPEQDQVTEVVAPLARRVVDEPDQVDAVLGMLQVLVRDQLPDIAGADDDRVLDVLGPASADRAGATTGERDQHDRERPEGSRLLEVRREEAGRVPDAVGDPDRHRDEMEDADDVVDGRVVGALLVAVVERVELRGDHPGRQRDQEKQPLRAGRQTSRESRPSP